MTGLLKKKYYVAVLDKDEDFISKVMNTLKSWYNNRIIIKSYTDCHEMFAAVNLGKANKNPFDVAVLSPDEVAEKMVLRHSNPDMKIIVCKDECSLKEEAEKVML